VASAVTSPASGAGEASVHIIDEVSSDSSSIVLVGIDRDKVWCKEEIEDFSCPEAEVTDTTASTTSKPLAAVSVDMSSSAVPAAAARTLLLMVD